MRDMPSDMVSFDAKKTKNLFDFRCDSQNTDISLFAFFSLSTLLWDYARTFSKKLEKLKQQNSTAPV